MNFSVNELRGLPNRGCLKILKISLHTDTHWNEVHTTYSTV